MTLLQAMQAGEAGADIAPPDETACPKLTLKAKASAPVLEDIRRCSRALQSDVSTPRPAEACKRSRRRLPFSLLTLGGATLKMSVAQAYETPKALSKEDHTSLPLMNDSGFIEALASQRI